MAKIIDPDDLTRSTTSGQLGIDGNIWIDVDTQKINLDAFGALNNATYAEGGVSLITLYSYLKEEWKTDPDLIKYPFPMVPIHPEQFEFVEGWTMDDSTAITYLRDGGFAVKNAGGDSTEEYICVISLGNVNGGQIYYTQESGNAATSDFTLTEAVNECVKVYGDASNGDFDYRNYFTIYSREYQKTYGQSSHTDIGVSTFTYQAYRFPLSNSADLNINTVDGTVGTTLPYTDIDITYLPGTGFEAATTKSYTLDEVGQDDADRWFICTGPGTLDAAGVADYTNNGGSGTFVAYSGEREIGTGNYYAYNVIIDADVSDDAGYPTLEQIYEKIQYDLRQAGDIDAGSGTVNGKTTTALLGFVGSTLVSENGVFIDDFSATDTNDLEFYDANGTKRTFPYVAAGALNFNSNLVDDSGAIYRMFFTDVSGNDFGDSDAILVDDNSGTPISGDISGSQVTFDFDYDGNTQGGRTAGTDADITVVAIGLDKAQYVVATGTIERSNANNISLVAALERNYTNP